MNGAQLDLLLAREPAPADTSSFVALVVPRHKALHRKALQHTRDESEADDLVQDTMVRAFRFWGSFTPGSNLDAWLFTILKNTFINGYHRANRERAALDLLATHAHTTSAAAVAGSNSAPPSAANMVDRRTTQREIAAALEQLPDDYRRVIELVDLDGLSYLEAAEHLRCPIGTVMSRLYRGRKSLHALLCEHAIELGIIDEDTEPGQRVTRFTRCRS